MTAVLATIKAVFLVLSILTPTGTAASPPRYILQPDLDTCLAQQQRAVQEADLSGLAHYSVACINLITAAGGGIINGPNAPEGTQAPQQ
jgi:hypothetical protein